MAGFAGSKIGFKSFLILGLFALLLLGPMASAAEPATGKIAFNTLSTGKTELHEISNGINYMLKIEDIGGKPFLNAYVADANSKPEKKASVELTSATLNTPQKLDSTGFAPKRSACIAKDGEAYLVATFPQDSKTDFDSALGGICNQGTDLLTFTGTLPIEKPVKAYKLKGTSVASGYHLQVHDSSNQKIIPASGVSELANSDGTPLFKSAKAGERIARVYAVVTAFGPKYEMKIWFREDDAAAAPIKGLGEVLGTAVKEAATGVQGQPAALGTATAVTASSINLYILPAGKKITETRNGKAYTFDAGTNPTNKITVNVDAAGTRYVLENRKNIGGDSLKATGRNFCIVKDGDSYVVATFADGVEYGIDSALGGICEEGALNIKINQGQILAGTEISALDKKYGGYKLEALLPATGAANVQIKDGKGSALLDKTKQEDQVSAGTPKAKKADARRKNGLKSEARIYTAIAQDFTAATAGTAATAPVNKLLVGFRDTLVKQDLIDLFAYAYNNANFDAMQSTYETDFKKIKSLLSTYTGTPNKEQVVLCYKLNEIKDFAKGSPKPAVKKGTAEENTNEYALDGRCDHAQTQYNQQGTKEKLAGFSISKKGGFSQLVLKENKFGTYEVTLSAELSDTLKNEVEAELTATGRQSELDRITKESRQLKFKIAKPFVGIQSKQKSRVLFVVNPVTTEEAKAYETANKGKKAVATPGADGKTASIILYLDNDLMKTTYNLRGAIFPESLVRLGWTGKIKDGWADIYVPEFDHASDLYAAFIGTAEKDVLDKNVDKEKSTTDKTIDTTVSTWWGSPVTAEAYDTPPRAFATIREYEKVCGLGADVIEYFSCTSGKWKLESPNIELTEAEKKGKDTAALKKLVADRTAKKVEELKAYKQADPAIAALRSSKTLRQFQEETCSGGKIYIDHADDIGMYKTPRFYALWTNILDALKESGAFQTYAKNGGILKVQVKPLQTYSKALDAEDKKKAAELAAEAKKRTTKPTEVQKDIAQQYSRLFLMNSPFATMPFHPFTFAFHRVAAPSGKTDLVQVATGMIQAWAMAPGANNVFLGKKVELLKQYLHPNPPAAKDQPLDERYKALYKKAAFDESYTDVAAVLEIRLPEKLGMEMSGYVYAGENKVPQSSRTSDGEKKLQEGFLTQMECTDSTVNGRYDIDPETKTTFERKEPVKAGEKIKCVNLPVTDAAKSWDADVALLEKEKKGEATGADALEVVKACRAIHNYYFQDFGITEQVGTKAQTKPAPKDKVVLNNLDLSKKYLYDITICPDKESCDAAPIIRPSDLLDIKLVQKKEKPAPVATKPGQPTEPQAPTEPGAPSTPTQPGQQPQQPGGQQPPAASPVKPPAEPPKTGGDEPARPAYEKTPQRQEMRTIPARVSQTGSGGSSSGTDTKAAVKTEYGTAQFNPTWLSQMQPSGWPGGNPGAYYYGMNNPWPFSPGYPQGLPNNNPWTMYNPQMSMYFPTPPISPWMTLAQGWPTTMYGGYPYYMPTASGAMQMYNLMLGDNFRLGYIKTGADGRKDFKMWAGQLALGGFRIGGFGFGSLRVLATVDKLEPGESVEFVLFTPEDQPPTAETISKMQPPVIEIGSVEEAPQQLVNTAGTTPTATPAAQQDFLLPAAFVILVIGVGWMWLNRGRRKAG